MIVPPLSNFRSTPIAATSRVSEVRRRSPDGKGRQAPSARPEPDGELDSPDPALTHASNRVRDALLDLAGRDT